MKVIAVHEFGRKFLMQKEQPFFILCYVALLLVHVIDIDGNYKCGYNYISAMESLI